MTRHEGDKAWRVKHDTHDKHGKFQYLILVLVILQLVFFEERTQLPIKDFEIPKLFHVGDTYSNQVQITNIITASFQHYCCKVRSRL